MLKRTEYSENTENHNVNVNNDELKDVRADILECAIKDDSGLNDFQKLPNSYGIRIPKVGIEIFKLDP